MAPIAPAELATVAMYNGAAIFAITRGIEITDWIEFDTFLKKVASGEETLFGTVAEAKMTHPDHPEATEEGRRKASELTRQIADMVVRFQEQNPNLS